MRKEYYENSSSVVIKRSPAVSGRKTSKTLASSTLAGKIVVREKNMHTSALGKAISNNINSIDKALNESNKIIPWRNNIVKKAKA